MPRGTPMRRRSGRPPEIVEAPAPTPSGHVIYEDGTYSNNLSVTVQKESHKDKLKVYDVILFEDGTKWEVIQLYDWGLAVAAFSKKRMPSMHDAVMYSWEELDEKKVRLV